MKHYLRRATLQDKKLIFDWANDPETRQNSFNTETIKWEDHSAWYDRKLSDENCQMYILMDFFKPLGQVRVDREGDKGVISYSIDKESRGQGLGKEMLSLLEAKLVGNKNECNTLVAEVKTENLGSRKVFEALGYDEIKDGTFQKNVSEKVVFDSKKKRDANLEVLRVIAMMMVIVLHYLNKGGLLHDPSTEFTATNLGFWLVECFALSCVNVYVLISGYYMVTSRFTFTRLFRTWGQVFFYSVGIAVFSAVTGLVPFDSFKNAYELLYFGTPILMGHYWFATAYMLLLCIAPILAAAVKQLTKKQFEIVLICLLSVFCFAKTIMPYTLIMDDQGNGILWFICLFLVAAYIRLYGDKLHKGKIRAGIMYILSSLGSWIYLVLAAVFVAQTGRFEHLWQQVTDFNFVFVFFASIGLFMLFKQIEVRENIFTKGLVKIAPYTFGVYLLHEHIHFAHRWIEWFKVADEYGYMRPLHLLGTVLCIFIVGIVIDAIRSSIFSGIESLFNVGLKIYYAKKEVWDYLIFGVLATVVNWIVYIFSSRWYIPFFYSGSDTVLMLISNTVAWVAAVIFAYWTNRCFVFKSETVGFGKIVKEFIAFVAARVFSFLVEQALMLLFLELMHMNDLVAKLVISVVVIVLNYVFSKLFIFKKKA